jgi:hypothetical protein
VVRKTVTKCTKKNILLRTGKSREEKGIWDSEENMMGGVRGENCF